MLFLILFMVIFITITLGPILFLRRLGSRQRPVPTFVSVQPLNTTGTILGSPNTDVWDKTKNPPEPIRVNNDGGRFIDMIHTIEGWVMDKRDPDPMNWVMLTEDEAKKSGLQPELKGLMFVWFNIQIIGLFRYVQINSVRKFRWGRKDNQTEYGMMSKTDHPLYPDFTGTHDFEMKSVETGKVLAFDLRGNLQVREKYPYRVRKIVADAYAQMTTIVNDEIVNFMSTVDPTKFFTTNEDAQKGAVKQLRKELTKLLKSRKVVKKVVDGTGLDIYDANLPALGFDGPTKILLEAAATAELEGNAAVIVAMKAKEARFHTIEAEAKHVRDVIMPTAENEKTVSVHWSQTMREQTALHTVVSGQGALPMLPLTTGSDDKKETTR